MQIRYLEAPPLGLHRELCGCTWWLEPDAPHKPRVCFACGITLRVPDHLDFEAAELEELPRPEPEDASPTSCTKIGVIRPEPEGKLF